MVTLISNPLGHKLSDSEIDAVIIDNGAGEALVYMATGHALVDGDYVYIQSNIESYNGYKYVDSIAYDSFKIRDGENSDAVEYIQDADITYRVSVLDHGYQCVHLPIVYELESDISPNNVAEEAYTPVTIISQSNEGGLTRLALSVGLNNPLALDKINLFGSGDLEGVYQIVTAYQDWNIVIDLPYDVTNSFTGLQVIKWYDNYTINVIVWAGLEPGHRWEDRLPFEIATTLQFVPDDNNRIKFSIAEVLKSYIKTRNNLTLDTLPNNLDFMVGFYIQYFESYDVSDGEEVTTFEGEVTTDDFIGHAINAKLPFKSESVSHLSDYINEDVYLAQWLTLQSRPIGVVGRFFDLSFINRFLATDITVAITKTLAGVSILETITITNPGTGVIRVPLEIESGYDEYCVQASTSGSAEGPGVTSAITLPALTDWLSRSTSGFIPNWGTGIPNPDVTVVGTGPFTPQSSEDLYCDYPFVLSYSYTIIVSYTKTYNSGSSNPRTITISAFDNSFNIIHTSSDTTPASPGGSDTVTLTFVSLGTETKVGISVTDGSDVSFVVTARSGSQTTPSTPAVAAQIITERICMDIIEECDSTFIPDETGDFRLLEDGSFRLLE